MSIIYQVEETIHAEAQRWGGTIPNGFGLYMNQRTHDDICEAMHQARGNPSAKKLKRLNEVASRDGTLAIHIDDAIADGEVHIS